MNPQTMASNYIGIDKLCEVIGSLPDEIKKAVEVNYSAGITVPFEDLFKAHYIGRYCVYPDDVGKTKFLIILADNEHYITKLKQLKDLHKSMGDITSYYTLGFNSQGAVGMSLSNTSSIGDNRGSSLSHAHDQGERSGINVSAGASRGGASDANSHNPPESGKWLQPNSVEVDELKTKKLDTSNIDKWLKDKYNIDRVTRSNDVETKNDVVESKTPLIQSFSADVSKGKSSDLNKSESLTLSVSRNEADYRSKNDSKNYSDTKSSSTTMVFNNADFILRMLTLKLPQLRAEFFKVFEPLFVSLI